MRAFAVLLLLFAFGVSVLAEADSAGGGAARTTTPSQSQARHAGAGPDSLLTQDMLYFWIAKWQRRLSLEDWSIQSKIVRASDLPERAVANIHWSLPTKKAVIQVLNSADSNLRGSEILRDTELSVVHELVHLSMSKLPLDAKHTELEEEAVKKLSVALLTLEDSKK
ncbi:MAG: hypothetical protein ABJF23_15335 [Bryobacteraceae bacterium]